MFEDAYQSHSPRVKLNFKNEKCSLVKERDVIHRGIHQRHQFYTVVEQTQEVEFGLYRYDAVKLHTFCKQCITLTPLE